MIKAVSALLGLLPIHPQHSLPVGRREEKKSFIFPRLVTNFRPFSSSPIMCRTRWSGGHDSPQNDLEAQLSARLGPHRLREALGQIRAYSPDRIQWTCKPGADVFGMTVAAVQAICQKNEKLHAQLTAGGIRFSNDQIVVDVATTGRGEFEFTAYLNSQSSVSVETQAALAACAADSIARDLSSNFRSYSWSSSSSWNSDNDAQFPLFDSRNPFGEMESFLGNFFAQPSDMFGEDRHPSFERPRREEWSAESPHGHQSRGNLPSSNQSSAVRELESMGAQVIVPINSTENKNKSDNVDWSSLAGYERVKAQVEESIILGLKHPSLFAKLIKKTRKTNKGRNRPKVVLFQGPPGTGKTSTCKIIANETNIPMIHIPLESIVSKWFGESEKHIARFYELGKQVAKEGNHDGVILFIDEIDSLVSSRDGGVGNSHEASKRILSVLLRHIDGFAENDIPTMLICATNRPQDLDSAFLNRVDSSVEFALPDKDSRIQILRLYAKHLTGKDLERLAEMTLGLSGRNLKDLCLSAERVWTASVIRGMHANTTDDDVDIEPPPLGIYLDEAKKKAKQQTGNSR